MSELLRKDLAVIADLVPYDAKVLELGCGDGALLGYLTRHKLVDGRGIELVAEKVAKSVQSGLSVIHGDIDADLTVYPDKCFDYVISSQVIQVTHRPKDVLKEMLRISKYCVVSIPNFGHWRNRFYLASQGKMPVTKALSYQWYETPNIHFCTILDFTLLCNELDCTIEDVVYLGASLQQLPALMRVLSPNMFSERAIFLLSS